MEKKTLFDKIWDSHVVSHIDGGPDVLFIDRHYIHEVTSPVAFSGIEQRQVPVMMPKRTFAAPDHNVPTTNQHLPITDELSRRQVETLARNCDKHKIKMFGLGNPKHGIIHVIGPELGLTLPGMTIVCGDSHTSTHGAFGNVAFGIGTSEVEMVLASQCIMQMKPKKMRITVDGKTGKGVGAKDIILYIISKISTSGGTGHFIEFAGEAIKNLTMEGRMTVCNMSIEMGARGGMIAPDHVTYEYLKRKEYAPKAREWGKKMEQWKNLFTDEGAVFDKEYHFDAADIQPMITYGTNPGMGIAITGTIPTGEGMDEVTLQSFQKALEYVDLKPGSSLEDKQVNWVFVGSCTNGRIEDLRQFASFVKGKKKATNIHALIVPGSKKVEKQAKEEGIEDILKEAGFELRQPGCSACLAMNEDKIPEGEYCVSTSNRNFEGRQGPKSRTFLASPLTAAAVAITGKITDPRKLM